MVGILEGVMERDNNAHEQGQREKRKQNLK
jgi:hypothetical protein